MGEMSFPLCQAGALVTVVGGDVDMTVEEFASCAADEYENAIEELWQYSMRVEHDQEGNEGVEMDQSPSIVVKGRARTTYQAAHIWAGFVWPRNRQQAHDRKLKDDDREYKKARIVALNKSSRDPPPGVGAAARIGDTAAMNGIADVTKKR